MNAHKYKINGQRFIVLDDHLYQEVQEDAPLEHLTHPDDNAPAATRRGRKPKTKLRKTKSGRVFLTEHQKRDLAKRFAGGERREDLRREYGIGMATFLQSLKSTQPAGSQ